MISSDVVNFRTSRCHSDDLSQYLQMGRGEVPFAELPDVYDIPVEHQDFWLYAVQIGKELVGMAGIRPQMDIGNHCQVYLPFFQRNGFECKLIQSV